MAAGRGLPVGRRYVLPCRLPRPRGHAAHGGHLETLQWLRAEGCPWNKHTCRHAAEQGHVEVLRWARENGCPWNAATRDRAAAELGYTDGFGNLVA